MQKNAYFIYNPVAGKGSIKAHLSMIVELFSKADYNLTLYATSKQDDAYHKMKEIGEHYPLVLCSGGDGTLNEIVNAYHELKKKPKLGYLPSGTTNDFAKSLKLDKSIRTCVKNILRMENEVTCDLGKFNNHCFSYVAAFGSISEVSYSTPQATKKALGQIAYLLEGLKQFVFLKKYHLRIEYDDGVIEDEFCLGMITNSLSVGGFKFFKEEDILLDDGFFECIFIKHPNNPLDLQQTLGAISSKKYKDHSRIYAFRSKKLQITCLKSIRWTLDGEYAGSHKECTIINLQKAISFIK